MIIQALYTIVILSTAVAAMGQTPDSPVREVLECITDQTAVGDGGNNWGGHQPRIVRTADGVFAVHITRNPGQGVLACTWHLMHRCNAEWQQIGEGPSDRDPVSLVADRDGRLMVLSYANRHPCMWQSQKRNGRHVMVEEKIPWVDSKNDFPYLGAGISRDGCLYLITTTTRFKPGKFIWARRSPGHGEWTWDVQTTVTDYRYCYAYLLPCQAGRLVVAATRDVPFGSLGLEKPKADDFDFLFNGVGVWHTEDSLSAPMRQTFFMAEEWTERWPYPDCRVQDGVIDKQGRLHLIVNRKGPTSDFSDATYHLIVDKGRILKETRLPSEAGYYCRLVQDSVGRWYILTHWGDIWPATDRDGMVLGEIVKLGWGDYDVHYAGPMIAAPRGGTNWSDIIDGVFPAGEQAAQWVYFRIRLR